MNRRSANIILPAISACIWLGAIIMPHQIVNATELTHQFGPGSFGDPAWMRRYNPALEHFQLDRGGWQTNYRGGDGAQPMNTAGFKSRFKVDGNFTAGLNYTLLQADTPPRGGGVGILFRIHFGDDANITTIGHVRRPGGQIIMFVNSKHDGESTYQQFPARLGASEMEIRHLGDGQHAFFGGSGGAMAKELCRATGPVGKPGQIDIWATTGQTTTPLKATVSAVHVDAEELPVGQVAATPRRFPWYWIAFCAAMVGGFGWLYRSLKTSSE
ncbi:hypothetical protein [Crateriforma conspicua]|uniref:DUF1583 domain-containing protein n=1 Tax=Crateriforma conspicua TaxID=2527996 RepID=A0A5C5YB14_9PLAN|nr:hypothetical protein [Crateriforma conspicua]TWT72324.1 hypothetical protein Pan14r_46440 [Crateriforma conspicua]